jgi:hypothetical protein
MASNGSVDQLPAGERLGVYGTFGAGVAFIEKARAGCHFLLN